jgi:hypothetical protein
MGITLFRYADLIQELEESCMNDVQSLIGLSFFNHTADVDFTCSLRNHFNVDAIISKCAEEFAADADLEQSRVVSTILAEEVDGVHNDAYA